MIRFDRRLDSEHLQARSERSHGVVQVDRKWQLARVGTQRARNPGVGATRRAQLQNDRTPVAGRHVMP